MKENLRKIIRIVLIGIFVVQCVFWIVSGILMLTHVAHIAVPLLMIMNGVVFGLLIWLYPTRFLLVRIGTVLFLFVNLVLSVTDQMGVLDVVALILNVIALACCLCLSIGGKPRRPPR
jgi:hypothetical protein